MSAPAGWYPQPGGQQRFWDGQQWTDHFAPIAPRKNPGLIVLLSSAGALVAVVVALSQADKKTITDASTPPSSVAESITAVWVFAGLVLLFIAIANYRIERWLPRAIVLILTVPVVTAAIFGTVKLTGYSGLIQNTQRIYAEKEHARVALKETGFAACAGNPVTGARGESPRSLVVFDDQGEFYAWDDVDRRGWAPGTVAGLKFVVCVGEEKKDTASWCNYEGGYSYKIIKFTREVRIVAAEDGQVSKSTVLSGDTPECVKMVSHKPDDEEGERIGEQQVIEYVASAL